MVVVADANILFSCLIKPDGRIGQIVFSDEIATELICPYFLIVEIFEHKEKIMGLSGLNKESFLELFYLLLTKVNFVKESNISINVWSQAHQLTKEIDYDDISYVALAIHFDVYFWSGDKVLVSKLRNKGFNKALYTTDVISLVS